MCVCVCVCESVCVCVSLVAWVLEFSLDTILTLFFAILGAAVPDLMDQSQGRT